VTVGCAYCLQHKKWEGDGKLCLSVNTKLYSIVLYVVVRCSQQTLPVDSSLVVCSSVDCKSETQYA